MNENNKELIAQLEQVDELLNKNRELDEYIKHGAAFEALENIKAIRAQRGAPPSVPSACVTMPIFPMEKRTYEPLEKNMNNKKMLFLGVLGVSALLFVIYYITHLDFLNPFVVIGIFASAVLGYLFFSSKNSYKTKKKAYDDSVELYEKTMRTFKEGLSCFDAEKVNATKEIKEYRARHDFCYIQYLQALDAYGENKENAQRQYDANSDQMKSIGVIPEEYYHLVTSIISILKSGRADSYKEALNLAIDDERQEREAQERREAEARRQAEEERRTAIMRQQAEEERRHNEQMERQQAQQAREAAHREEQRQRRADDEKRKADIHARSIASSRCSHCANRDRCPPTLKNNGGGANCGGFVPGQPR